MIGYNNKNKHTCQDSKLFFTFDAKFPQMDPLIGARVHITGVVQGVGFRPFVFALAKRYSLVGWVRNTSAGVDIEIDTSAEVLDQFIQALQSEIPPLARIDKLSVETCPPNGFIDFQIIPSQSIPDAFQPISPDVSICADCLKELYNPGDQRYLYPFINCTNCGPRFTIIEDIPYDRPNTTMSTFEMCTYCKKEYLDPLNRRFHAQPVACPDCGPGIWIEYSESINKNNTTFRTKHLGSRQETIDTILETQNLLSLGKIVAIKGLGGFHLACNALDQHAVDLLRERKLRVDKPFALMMPDTSTVEKYCFLNENEETLLGSRERPIVILQRKPGSAIPANVAPGQDTLGVMLPYTPLHHLLFSSLAESSSSRMIPEVLVMTSGNLSEEPIATSNQEARQRLSSLADAFLMHNRPIQTRCDDSVTRVFELPQTHSETDTQKTPNATYPLRRSRGYAPNPIQLKWESTPTLAVGAELKNVFCLTRQEYAFMSHYIGDMENFETLQAFEEGIEHLERLFRISPKVVAYDLHPDYLATRYALERAKSDQLMAIAVQHHHAHIAACMAENGLPNGEPVIGLAFDGIGYGDDGAIWGGEFFIADYQKYQRPYHLWYAPLPGGDLATKEPWRMALSWLATSNISWDETLIPVKSLYSRATNPELLLSTLKHQIRSGLNSPLTSSMGRLFDAVAALIGVRQTVNYEAQAAIELESIAAPDEKGYYPIIVPDLSLETPQMINPAPLFQSIIEDLNANVPVGAISARFHNSLAAVSYNICMSLRKNLGINSVVLSGGVWQNIRLLRATCEELSSANFKVFVHRQVPANDGGIALGQAAVAHFTASSR